MSDIHSLLCDANDRLGCGNLQSSFELNLKALIIAIEKLQRIKCIHQYVIAQSKEISSLFTLAHTCLKNAEDISHKIPPVEAAQEKLEIEEIYALPVPIKAPQETMGLSDIKTRPPLPPKPSSMTKKQENAPPLPVRPRKKTALDLTQKYPKPPPLLRLRSLQPTLTTCAVSDSEIGSCDEDDEEFDINLEDEENVLVFKEKDPRTRPRMQAYRRSSTSNIPISPSPLSANPLHAVKTFLSLPGIISHSEGNKKTSGLASLPMSCESSRITQEYDEILALAQDAIQLNSLVHVQTNSGDTLEQSNIGSYANYLPCIPQAPLSFVYHSMRCKLNDVENEMRELKQCPKNSESDLVRQKQLALSITESKSTLNRIHSIHISATTVPTILQFPPVLIAYQLTLIDSAIFRNIPSKALQEHSAKTPHPAIVASTDFFNYLTRMIEHAILLQQEASGRAQHVNHWIKVACKCHDLKNYQTLKAIISALGTPPIQRLKRTWAFVPKKSLTRFETIAELMSEASNYGKYRERLGIAHEQQQAITTAATTTATVIATTAATLTAANTNSTSSTNNTNNTNSTNNTISINNTNSTTHLPTLVIPKKEELCEPMVPFLGIFIHDMTYLMALQKSKKTNEESFPLHTNISSSGSNGSRFSKDPRILELGTLFEYFQKRPCYSTELSPVCIKDLYKSRRRKLSHALRGNSSTKKYSAFSTSDDETGELCTEMQQCLVTQYLLTRPWVGEKTVDELSLLREPPKTMRSNSTTEVVSMSNASLSGPSPPVQGPFNANGSAQEGLRNSGSSSGSSSGSGDSRPISIDDPSEYKPTYDVECLPQALPGAGLHKLGPSMEESRQDKKETKTGFWLFGKKGMETLAPKMTGAGLPCHPPSSSSGEGANTIQRSPRHLSLDELEESMAHPAAYKKCERQPSPPHREGSFSSQTSLATLFRKDFWKSSSHSSRTSLEQYEPMHPTDPMPSGSAAKGLMLVAEPLQQKESEGDYGSPVPFETMDTKVSLYRCRSSSSLNKIKKTAKPEQGRHTIGRSSVPKQPLPLPLFYSPPHPFDVSSVQDTSCRKTEEPLMTLPQPLVLKQQSRTYGRRTMDSSAFYPLHDRPVAFKPV
ncbi:hypothetical protein BDF14DRAFT_1786720 [Spinellus fusiger]|nr:hypothetical protein BDF14DRAFT_1786720 [Spinellus fusiger]